jgi:hypothetical protein
MLAHGEGGMAKGREMNAQVLRDLGFDPEKFDLRDAVATKRFRVDFQRLYQNLERRPSLAPSGSWPLARGQGAGRTW